LQLAMNDAMVTSCGWMKRLETSLIQTMVEQTRDT